MAELLTIQDSIDGRLDIKSLGEAANGDENTQIITRTGETYPSAKKAIKTMFANGGLPAQPFATKALMTASALANGSYAQVTDDTANNGLYLKTAGAWVKSAYDPLTLAKADATTKADAAKTQSIETSKSYADVNLSKLERSIVRRSNNLYNKSTVTKNVVLNTDGTQGSASNYYATDFIAVKPSQSYTMSSIDGYATFLHVIYYDVNKVYISGATNPNIKDAPITITTPANTAYVRFDIGDSTFATLDKKRMFNEGATAFAHEEYLNELKYITLDGAVVTDVERKLLVNKGDYDFSYQNVKTNGNLFNPNSVVEGMYVSDTGVAIGSAAYVTSEYISVYPNRSYTFSSKAGFNSFPAITFYNKDKVFLGYKSINTVNKTETILMGSDVRYVRLNAGVTAENTVFDSERMMNIGSTALPYAPYEVKLLGVTLDNVNEKLGQEIRFSGDKHKSILLDFDDEFTTASGRNIKTEPTTLDDLDAWWGALVTEFPDYVTKQQIGMDASGEFPIWSYIFSPSKPLHQTTNQDYLDEVSYNPRVLVMTQHLEQGNQLYMWLAFRELCKSWSSQPALAALRTEVDFVCVPTNDPWGYPPNTELRNNVDGIDLNRDWEHLPNHPEVQSTIGPFWQAAETLAVRDLAEVFKPHVFIDLHSNYSTDEGVGVWCDASTSYRQESTMTKVMSEMYPVLHNNDPATPKLNKLLRFTYYDVRGSAGDYIYKIGCTGGLVEIVKDYNGANYDNGIRNDGLIFGASALLNMIVGCIAEYRDFGEPTRGIRDRGKEHSFYY